MEQKNISNIQNDKKFRTLLSDIGGHCRALEFLYKGLGKFNDSMQDYHDRVLYYVIYEIQSQYCIEEFPLEALIAFSFLSKQVEETLPNKYLNGSTFRQLEEKGLIKLVDGKVVIPYIFTISYLSIRESTFSKFWSNLLISDNFCWQDWEVFNRNYMALRLSLFSFFKDDSTISINKFFEGGKIFIPSDVKIMIKIPTSSDIELLQSKKIFPKHSADFKNGFGQSILNAPFAPFDSFMYLKTLSNEKILLAFQMKFAYTDSETPQTITNQIVNKEYNKMNDQIAKNVPGTDFVCIIMARCDSNYCENLIPTKSLIVSNQELKDFYGETLFQIILIQDIL